MPFVVFVGCDGSGKSTVIDRLTKHLESAGVSVRYGHWCPTKGAANHGGNAPDPHSQVPRNSVTSTIKLGVLAFRWWRAWALDGWGKAADRGVVLFDRYHGDLLVDPLRYRYGGPHWLARLWSRCLPQPDHLLFLDAAPEVLLSRKQEVSREALERSRTAYLGLMKSKGGRVVDVARPVDEIVAEILQMICPNDA